MQIRNNYKDSNYELFMNLIARLKNVIGEDLFKNELQAYVIEEVDIN